MKRLLFRCLLVPLLILPPPEAGAETPEERGFDIAARADRRDTGWGDTRSSLEMILRNQHGDESRRALRTSTLEVSADGDKVLTVFEAPPDIKGTALLSYTHAMQPDDQWLYLPALKKTKRIASVFKSGPFVGSEFAYEDLVSSELDKYSYLWIEDSDLHGKPVHVLERYPAYGHSGYQRQIVWIDTDTLRPLRVDFFDRKNALLKTLTYDDYRLYLGQYWRAQRMTMNNHQTGKSTELLWRDYQFQTGLTERDFDRNALKRVR